MRSRPRRQRRGEQQRGRAPRVALHQARHTLTTKFREHTLIAMLGIPMLLRHPVWRQADPDQGKGLVVLLIPGFGFGDRSLTLIKTWLRARGYRPESAGIGMNLGCTAELVERIEQRMEELSRTTGSRVVLLGQSRGGWLGRIAAVHRPDLVRGLVMLGSAVLDPLKANPKVLHMARLLARISAWGVPGLVDTDCFSGDCYRSSAAALSAPLPEDVPALALYSYLDGLAPWHLCRDPYAEPVEVGSSHTGMSWHPNVYRAVEPRLAEWAAADFH